MFTTIKRKNTIKRSNEIRAVLHNGKRWRGKNVNIVYREKGKRYPAYAICISKKEGNAVQRNKVKRIIRQELEKSGVVKCNTRYDLIISKYPQQGRDAAAIRDDLERWSRQKCVQI